ncbi:MAG TPA: NAD(+) diphosphatase [Candidatus Wallbacteria bacterium]|nr:NAD(+) diphosphatase [Candidatus Wallbacteria bacterium]
MENNTYLFLKTIPPDIAPASFFLIFYKDKLLVKKNNKNEINEINETNENSFVFVRFSDISDAVEGLKPGIIHFLGVENGFNYYSFQAQNSFESKNSGFEFYDLRSLMSLFDADQFRLACLASQVLYWDQTTKFCGECGSETLYSLFERAKTCAKCSAILYPVITPAIVVAVMKEDKILLAHNKKFADGVYSLIAGFVDPGESLEECVAREVMEETGIAVSDVKYFKSQPWPFPSSLMVGFTASYGSGEIKPDGVEITHAAWFGRGDLPLLPRYGSLSRKIIDALMTE